MADCKQAPSAIPEAIGLKTINIDGTRWVVSVQANEALGYSRPGMLTHRLLNERQFVRGRDYRTLRGHRCVKAVKAFGMSGHIHSIVVLTEEALGRVVASRTGDQGEHARGLVVASQHRDVAPAPTADRLGLARHAFEGHDVPTLTIAGQECWVAHDVGRVLDYGRDGRTLVQMVSDKWREEFTEGEHYVVAKGEILKGIKDLLTSITDGDRSFGPSLMLLTRAGLWLVLDKTEKPVGQRFRRWLSGEVRQAAEEGRAVATGMNGEALPAVSKQLAFDFGPGEADMARERRLLTQANHRHEEAGRKLDLEVGKLQVGFAEKVVGWDLADPLKREVVRATAKAIGLDVAGVQ